MKRKRPFLLLEVLFAMTLLTLCIVPLMRQPMLLNRAELKQFKKIEWDRIAAWTFTEIREKLIKNEIAWSQIPSLKETSHSFPLPDVPYQLPSLATLSASRSFTLRTLKEKQDERGRTLRLVAVKITIGEKELKREFTYRITVIQNGSLKTI
jgi:hypothetical protein